MSRARHGSGRYAAPGIEYDATHARDIGSIDPEEILVVALQLGLDAELEGGRVLARTGSVYGRRWLASVAEARALATHTTR